MTKEFKLTKDEIKQLVHGIGGCFATDMITVEGYPVRFMYREDPDNDIDSGWRFMSGFEDEIYMNNPENHAVYDVNTIANYDPAIIPLLDSPTGSVFERPEGTDQFVRVTDWEPPDG
jgi:hypothetical protein